MPGAWCWCTAASTAFDLVLVYGYVAARALVLVQVCGYVRLLWRRCPAGTLEQEAAGTLEEEAAETLEEEAAGTVVVA